MKTLPDNFFFSPLANDCLEDLNDFLTRIKPGPYHEALIFWHLKHASPTFGLIIAGRRANGEWKYYWHQLGFVEAFEAAAQYPRVYKSLGAAKRQVQKLNEGVLRHSPDLIALEQDVQFEIVVWTHPDVGITPNLEKYADMKRQFPGSPKQ